MIASVGRNTFESSDVFLASSLENQLRLGKTMAVLTSLWSQFKSPLGHTVDT